MQQKGVSSGIRLQRGSSMQVLLTYNHNDGANKVAGVQVVTAANQIVDQRLE